MAAPQIDVLAAVRAGAQELAAQIADLTLELAAQRAAGQQMLQRIAELEQQLAEKDDALAAAREKAAAEAPEA